MNLRNWLVVPIPPPQPSKSDLEREYGRRIYAFEYSNIICKFNEKHNINQKDFDDYSFDNAEEAAHWGKLNNLACDTPEMRKRMNDARDLQNSLNEPKKPRTAYVLSDHSSDSDNNNSVPVPTELDLTLLPSSDDSSTSSDGVSNSVISQTNIQEDTSIDMSISCVNKDDDDAPSSYEDSDFCNHSL